ncbi:DVU0298 family protein [Desulfogranum mediterraneum]|uniref:DVU0298 family protein n=1 Tax=Desulfogranum mediterraneum TaxID=160661 RepID=UPI00041ED9FE|nr:DVU0298 family protein [Desulfogranum mediterraneum]
MERGKTNRRWLKEEVLRLCAEEDLATITARLAAYPAKEVINALFGLLCRESPRLRWQAITAMGISVARLAAGDMEEARVVMRRLLWSLNDESGGIGWGAPEAMAEVMCCQPELAGEYAHMLLSYMREDGDEPWQDGNFLEHSMLQRGLLWGIARLAEAYPRLLAGQVEGQDFLSFLDSEDGEVRGLAAWAVGILGLEGCRSQLEALQEDRFRFNRYHHQQLEEVSVARLAEAALAGEAC